jgi:hypothetical protein
MLAGKKILVISPQAWGSMFLSKHHYALELARFGASVYFLNPPEQSSESDVRGIHVETSQIHNGLQIISHRLRFPYSLRFRLPRLFHWLMRFHISKILNCIGRPDIVWSFDLGNLYPLNLFPESARKVFHPVDEPLISSAFEAAQGAEIIFSVTKEILEKYKDYPVPRIFINHGVSEEFLNAMQGPRQKGRRIVAGISGNFLRTDIDREILLQIIRDNPEVDFHCWGSFEPRLSNIGGGQDFDTVAFVRDLQGLPNVTMFGPIGPKELASGMSHADIFLICYDVVRDQSKGTNYHKIMEYLTTGKAIVSNNVTTYQGRPDLVLMVNERDNNRRLPELFRKAVDQIDTLNAPEMQDRRKLFAGQNTYKKQVMTIEKYLEDLTA